MTDDELRESVKKHGQTTTILYHGGRLLDGRRVERACLRLGIRPRTVAFQSLRAALCELWTRHPRRAITLCPVRGEDQQARYLGVTVGAIRTHRPRATDATHRHARTVRRLHALCERVESGASELTLESVRACLGCASSS